MKRNVWLAYALSFSLVVAAMAGVSALVLQQSHQQRQTLQQDEKEELVRLALWRMDAALATLVTQESTRPFAQYAPTHTVTYQPPGAPFPQTMLLPSPLLNDAVPYVKLHFRLDADGQVSAPYDDNVPQPRPDDGPLHKPRLRDKQPLLDQLATLNKDAPLADDLPATPNAAPVLATLTPLKLPSRLSQSTRNQNEAQRRVDIVQLQNSQQNIVLNKSTNRLYEPTRESLAKAYWRPDAQQNPCLLIARRVTQDGKKYVVGCWLDWPGIRSWLLGTIRDLLPNASLVPAASLPNDAQPNHAAMLPIRLEPGTITPTTGLDTSGPWMLLAVAWGGVILSGFAVAMLLTGVVALGERRTTFATAVTHELRTPLTSMQLYTEMLADGMITDDDKKKAYLTTLHGETIRLATLVENVLQFGKLESKNHTSEKNHLTVSQLLTRLEPRLIHRVEQAQMTLDINATASAQACTLHVHPTDIEQILENLVDNACKYAADATDRRVHLTSKIREGRVEFLVCDHGPGIAEAERKTIFQPFRKAKRDAVGTRGGIGLGLALCKRLAKRNRGNLTCQPQTKSDDPAHNNNTPGACFQLTLPTRS